MDGQFAGFSLALFPEEGQCPEASTPLFMSFLRTKAVF